MKESVPENGENAGQDQGDHRCPPFDAFVAKDRRDEDNTGDAAHGHSDQHRLRRRLILRRAAQHPSPQPLPLVRIRLLIRVVVPLGRDEECARLRSSKVRLENVDRNERDAEDGFGGHDRECRPEDPAASPVGSGGDGTGCPAEVVGERGEEEPAGEHAL